MENLGIRGVELAGGRCQRCWSLEGSTVEQVLLRKGSRDESLQDDGREWLKRA